MLPGQWGFGDGKCQKQNALLGSKGEAQGRDTEQEELHFPYTGGWTKI